MTTNYNAHDPFELVKSEIQNALKTADSLFSQYSSTGSKATLTELDSCLQGIYIDLDDLRDSVKAVEVNPHKFGLNANDIKQRSKFILDTQQKADSLKAMVNDKKSQVERQSLFRNASNKPNQIIQKPSQQNQKPSDNSQFIENEKQQQQMLMKQQDDQLDQVLNTVGTLKEVAKVMGNELEDQSKLLEEMEIQVDSTQDKLQAGLKRVNEFIKENVGLNYLIHI